MALRYLHWRSAGVPRLINIIADRALVAGYVAEASLIGWPLVRRAANEVMGNTLTLPPPRRSLWLAAWIGGAALALLAWLR